MGRPRHFDNEEELSEKINEYFAQAGKVTLTGLALYLGFESRQSVYDYEKDGRFSYTIKKARLRVENHYEEHLLSDKATGAIFALKNFGWADNQNLNLKTEQPIFTGIDLSVPKDNGSGENS